MSGNQKSSKQKKSALSFLLPLGGLLAIFFLIIVSVVTCLYNQLNPKSIALPYNLGASVSKDGAIALDWHWEGDLKRITGFIVERKDADTSSFHRVGEAEKAWFEDHNVDATPKRYLYRVYAQWKTLRSDYSNEAFVEIKAPEPTAQPQNKTQKKAVRQVAAKKPKATKPPALPEPSVEEASVPDPTVEPDESNNAAIEQPTPSQAPKLTETAAPIKATPSAESVPVPETEVGKVWFVPGEYAANVGDSFTTEIHVNTGEQKLLTYTIELSYPERIISPEEFKGTNGIATGLDGFISQVKKKGPGVLTVTGTLKTAKRAAEDLHLLTVFWRGTSPGISTVEIRVPVLKDESGVKIGVPRGIDGNVSIMLKRINPNEKLYILVQEDPEPTPFHTPAPENEAIVESTPTPEATPARDTIETIDTTPEPEQENAEPEPTPDIVSIPEPEPDIDHEVIEPMQEPTPVVTYEPYEEPTVEPSPLSTIEPTSEPTIAPTAVPTGEPTVEPEWRINTPEPTEYAPPTPDPTIAPEPTAAAEQTPYDPPPQGAGTVWFVPQRTFAKVNSSVSVQVHVNSGNQKLGAYGIRITYVATVVQIERSLGTHQGIEAGPDGFISVFNASTPGTLVIAGFDAIGKGPSTDLYLLKTYWTTKARGASRLNIIVTDLSDVGGNKIGYPNGIPGEIVVE